MSSPRKRNPALFRRFVGRVSDLEGLARARPPSEPELGPSTVRSPRPTTLPYSMRPFRSGPEPVAGVRPEQHDAQRQKTDPWHPRVARLLG